MILVDGQPATVVDVADRGLAYGDGLFETMRLHQGQITRLDLHLARLQQGCQRLRLNPDLVALKQELEAVAQACVGGVIKLMVTRGSGQRGYVSDPQQAARRIVQHSALPDWPQSNFTEGVALFACQTRLARQPLLAGIKHLNRLEQVLARAEWNSSEYAEGLMLDTAGLVTDGVFSNLFFVRAGELHTPLLDQAGVAGVMRAQILELAQQLGLNTYQRPIELPELADMDEVFCCNSLYGIWPVRRYAELQWQAGALTLELQQQIACAW